MKGPSFKDRMTEGRPMLGTFLQIPSGEIAEIAGSAGLDFAIVDTEHGMLGTDASLAIIRGCDAVGLTTIYRVPSLDHHRIGLALDMGASAVMVPNVVSRAQADEVIDAAKYHPGGNRGVCIFSRAPGYNAEEEGKDYYNRANRETAVILQIEGTDGIANLDCILETPGLDCIFIGPYDLSQSMGMPGAVTDDRVLAAMKDIVQRADERGIAMANFPVTVEQAKRYQEIGVRFLAFGTDTLVLQRAFRDCRRAILGE